MTGSGLDLAKFAGALSKPLVKLIETVESGIGAIGQPVLIILNAHAEGKAKLIRAGYDHQLKNLKAKHRAELAAANTTKPPKLLPKEKEIIELGPEDIEVIFDDSTELEIIAAKSADAEQQVKRRANLVTIAAEAAERVADKVADERVDPDWTARFFSHAQDVSNSDLQRLWGQLLAKEVEQPGRVPLRTLDLLRNMTKTDAEIFQRFAARVTAHHAYLPCRGAGLSPGELLTLADAGLIEDSMRTLRWVKDDEPGEVPRAEVRVNWQTNGWPAKHDLPYSSGRVVSVKTPSNQYTLSAYVVPPRTLPLIEIVNAGTSVEYLRSLVEELNSQPYFHASLSSPA